MSQEEAETNAQKASRITKKCILIIAACCIGFDSVKDLGMSSPTLGGLSRFFSAERAPFKRLGLGSWSSWVQDQRMFKIVPHTEELQALEVCRLLSLKCYWSILISNLATGLPTNKTCTPRVRYDIVHHTAMNGQTLYFSFFLKL